MGCCVSSTSKRDLPHSSPTKQPAAERKISPHAATTSPPPPSASLEEETVKEVLSETPISNPPQLTSSPTHESKSNPTPIFLELERQVQIFQDQFQEPRSRAEFFREPKNHAQILNNKENKNNEKEDKDIEITSQISQASEVCSIADTFSTATTITTTTTIITEIREDDEVTSRKRAGNNGSPCELPTKRPYNGDNERVKKRPPVKREFSGRSRTTTTMNQRNAGSSRVGKDVRERSRSPATRGAVKSRGGGSPAKMTGKAVGKVKEAGGLNSKEVKSKNDSALMQEERQQVNEFLDNPLVSLECFIFV